MNKIAMTQKVAKFDYVFGSRLITGPVPVGASTVFKNTGGKFCWFDTSRRLEIAGSGNNPDAGAFIFGWALTGAYTSSSTEGGDSVQVDVSTNSVYRMPADAAVLATMRGKSCDLVTTSDIQYADIGEANEKYLIIVDVDIKNQWVYVRMNPAAIYITAIA
jgi:hypothetical protein